MTVTSALDRSWAAVMAAAVALVAATSEVGLNLWFVTGALADVVAISYCVLLAAIAIEPNQINLHRVAGPVSALFWGGRGAAFLELVIVGGRVDLVGAVAERAAILVAVVTLHLVAARRIGLLDALAKADADG